MKSTKTNLTAQIPSILTICMILLIWQAVAVLQIVPDFMLPSPVSVGKALVNDFPLLMQHARYTVLEAMLGLTVGILRRLKSRGWEFGANSYEVLFC